MVCTFFGHHNVSDDVEQKIASVLIDLIENKGVTDFYVGNQGKFDYYVRKNLKSLKKMYLHIQYSVVLAYFPVEQRDEDYTDTIFPDGLEKAIPRFAIIKRNEWMIERADYVVTYVSHPFGNAEKFKKMALKKGKTVIELAQKS